MRFFRQYGFIVFSLFAIADIVFVLLELDRYRYATKSFLLPILLVTILANAHLQKHPVSKPLLTAALVIGTLGDIFLIDTASNTKAFLYGLVCFLIMQVLFLVYFIRMQAFKAKFLVSNLIIGGLLLVYCFLMMKFLWPVLGDLKRAVPVYALVVSAMFLAAINVYHSKRAGKLAVKFFIPGAGLLVLSDSLLAFNHFLLHEDFLDLFVMATYILGQLLLAVGFIKHLKSGRHGTRRKLEESSDEPLAAIN